MDSRTLIALFVLLCGICLAYAAVDAKKDVGKCKPGYYYNLRKERCTLCSLCKKHQVPLLQCYGARDTLCGTLGNFEFRQKSDGKDAKTEVIYELPGPSREGQTTETSTTQVKEDRWFAITMVLTGILAFTCILGVILVLVTCYMCRKKEREIIYDPVYTSSLIKDGQITEPTFQQFKVVTEAHRV